MTFMSTQPLALDGQSVIIYSHPSFIISFLSFEWLSHSPLCALDHPLFHPLFSINCPSLPTWIPTSSLVNVDSVYGKWLLLGLHLGSTLLVIITVVALWLAANFCNIESKNQQGNNITTLSPWGSYRRVAHSQPSRSDWFSRCRGDAFARLHFWMNSAWIGGNESHHRIIMEDEYEGSQSCWA